jgi:hypothetical protein
MPQTGRKGEIVRVKCRLIKNSILWNMEARPDFPRFRKFEYPDIVTGNTF